MYALNQTNALYFFPHRISFAPHPVEAERYHRWAPRCLGSAAMQWPPSDIQAREADRMDDDGAAPAGSAPGGR